MGAAPKEAPRLTPQALATIRQRALLDRQLGPSDRLTATLAADLLLLLEELQVKNAVLESLVHGSPGEAPMAGADKTR